MIESRRAEVHRMNKDIHDWVQTFPEEFRKERRHEYLKQEFRGVKAEVSKLMDKPPLDGLGYWHDKALEKASKRLGRIKHEMQVIRKEKDNITPEQIELARNYPLDELVEHKGKFAKCPFHNDHKPSMFIKNNFYHCFVCEANGDVIDYVMKTTNMSFRDAITYLT